MKHHKIYIGLLIPVIILGALASFFIWGILIPQSLVDYPKNLPFLYAFGFITSFMTVLLLTTIILRSTNPKAGKVISKISNFLMILYCIPLGTIIGIYGLVKLDKEN